MSEQNPRELPVRDYDDYEALHFERLGDVLRVVVDHPTSKLNAVDALLHDEFTRLFRELKLERHARAVLLTGRGAAFSAGGDFDWFPSLDNLEKLEDLRRDAKQMIWDLLDVEIPIVAAINVHRKIMCMWANACDNPDDTSGSPPRSRSSAAETSAALKKMITK